MKLIIAQGKKKEINLAVYQLMRMSKTNLTKVCENHNLDYGHIYRKLNSKNIELEWLESFIEKINPKARFQSKFSVSLMLDESIIINQKIKKDVKSKS